ncbi:hypothetical protein B0O99DRAFT_745437 [Bisporella sp. PMI_857]|nr:hypothetical protein B0O99DRAFT_745437 [Bisporella sp. PMI_857]
MTDLSAPRLPPLVMLDVLFFCDVPTLKALRLAHGYIRDLIEIYQASICSHAADLFFSEEEIRFFRPLSTSLSPIITLFAMEYRFSIAKWLADVGLENQEDFNPRRLGPYGNIAAYETKGDTVRGIEYEYLKSWLNWFVLREGPPFFIKAWSSEAGNKSYLKRIVTEWSKRSEHQVRCEKSAAAEVEEALQRVSRIWGARSQFYGPLWKWSVGRPQLEKACPGIPYHLGRWLPKEEIKHRE